MSLPLVPPEIGRLGARELFLNETFSSIQGESMHAGRPCFFIRLTGCSLRCAWCDTEYAFHEGTKTTIDACVDLAKESGIELVEVTGGEPLLQKATPELLRELCDAGFEVLLETAGALPIDQVDTRVKRIVDWKPPGSGEEDRNLPAVLDDLRKGDELKVVVADRRDYEWTRAWLHELCARRDDIGTTIPVHLSPVFEDLHPRDLAEWILEDQIPVRLNLQLHKAIWPPDARGV